MKLLWSAFHFLKHRTTPNEPKYTNVPCYHIFFGFDVVSVRMSLQDLTPGEDCDKWHNLIPVNSTTKGEPSSLRINCKYLYEVIMPLDEYKSLKDDKLM